MDYNFDWNFASNSAPYITISSSGVAFNSRSIELLGRPEKIQIGFDKTNLVLGASPFDAKRGGDSYEFSSRIRNDWIRIGCKDFVKNIGLLTGRDFKKAKKLLAKYDEDSQLLYVALGSTPED